VSHLVILQLFGFHGAIRYFGRAKDLPGVRELFQSRKKEEEEENQALAFYKKFMNQGPAYFGDLDDNDDKLLEFEREAEQEGKATISFSAFSIPFMSSLRMGRTIFKFAGNAWPFV
jgi:Isy1-like splicing family